MPLWPIKWPAQSKSAYLAFNAPDAESSRDTAGVNEYRLAITADTYHGVR